MQAEGSLLSLTNLRGLWSTWSELGGAARDVVDVVRGRRGRSSAELLGTRSTWSRSTWSELGGAARDVVDVVAVDVVGARRGSLSCSLRGLAWLAYGLAGSLDVSTWLI